MTTVRFYFFAYPPKLGPNFFFGAPGFGGVAEVVVQLVRLARKNWALLAGIIAHSEDKIKGNTQIFVYVIGSVPADVDAVFGHGSYGAGVHAMGFNACAVYHSPAAGKVGQIAVGYLAST